MAYTRRPTSSSPVADNAPTPSTNPGTASELAPLGVGGITPERAHALAGVMGNSALASLTGVNGSPPPASEKLHGPPIFSTMLETSWALEDGAGWMDGAQDSLLDMGPLPWLAAPGLSAAALGGAWLGEQTLSGMSRLTNNAATGIGILETMPGLGDFLDFGVQSARMGWAAATDRQFREDLMDPSTRKQAVKNYLGNPSDAGVPLTDLFEGTDADRQQGARNLLLPHKDAILDAASANALEPEMVGALALTEQRDQRGAENVMDWLMGTVMGEGETSSGLTQVTANSARRYDLVDDQHRMTDRQLAIALHDPATNLMAGAERLRIGANLGAQAEADGRNLAADDLMAPGQRVDLSVMGQHSSDWHDAHRRLAIEEYTSSPFDDELLQSGHIPGASSWWGWFGVEGYHDIQKAGIFDPAPSTTP